MILIVFVYRLTVLIKFTLDTANLLLETAYKLCIGQDVKESPNACLLGCIG